MDGSIVESLRIDSARNLRPASNREVPHIGQSGVEIMAAALPLSVPKTLQFSMPIDTQTSGSADWVGWPQEIEAVSCPLSAFLHGPRPVHPWNCAASPHFSPGDSPGVPASRLTKLYGTLTASLHTPWPGATYIWVRVRRGARLLWRLLKIPEKEDTQMFQVSNKMQTGRILARGMVMSVFALATILLAESAFGQFVG